MQAVFEQKNQEIDIKAWHHALYYAPMFHPHLEIIYVTEKSMTVTVDGTTHTICAGEFCIIFPYAVHSYEATDDVRAYLLMFSPSSAGIFEKTLLTYKPQSPFGQGNAHILSLLARLHEFDQEEGKLTPKLRAGYLMAVIGEILRELTLFSLSDSNLDTIQRVLIYCSAHFDEVISIKSISDALYVSPSYITKIFSSKLRIPFREYINILRISKAKNLLHHSNMKVIDIMYDCGFENQSSFNRVFQKICNMSPSTYRNMYQ